MLRDGWVDFNVDRSGVVVETLGRMSRPDPDRASEAQSDLLAIVGGRPRRSARWPLLLLAATGVAVVAASAAYWVRSRWVGPEGPASIAMSLDTPNQSGSHVPSILSPPAPAGQDRLLSAPATPAPADLATGQEDRAGLSTGAGLPSHAGRRNGGERQWSSERRYHAARWHGSYRYGSYARADREHGVARQPAEPSVPPRQSAPPAPVARPPVLSASVADEGRRAALERYQRQIADTQAATAAYAADQAAYQQEMARSRKAQEDYDKARPKKDR